MVEPTIVPRAAHAISRRAIDPDALKVLYRLHENGHIAYLVGGSVRDLLLERRPKDFDIGTSAQPHQIKKLFRNCWIIGRRFRLAHVKFGTKTIEVATFRRQVPAADVDAEAAEAAPEVTEDNRGNLTAVRPDRLIQRDNAYGTPEEDAFRRDFTVNALFYDIGTFSIIDYVGGLADLDARVIRSIGDPDVRFLEDPVRMLRAVVLAARLEFTIDAPILESIGLLKHEIARSAPARLVEEYYKILRSGHAEEAFKQLRATGLLKAITPELATEQGALTRAVAALDRYRARFPAAPDTLTNAILAGTLLFPLGLIGRRARFSADPLERRVELGLLPIARRDVERLHQILAVQQRLTEIDAPARAQRGVLHRSAFPEALTWLEIHGDRPDAVAHWRELQQQQVAPDAAPVGEAADHPLRRRRRRRRRRPRFAAE
ncbi:MAG TPA: polynucleotide adenylyltransferase PcnB [Vicinamibacterales bacterium]|jgi:poly(A) polymerase|nr:polynucleotide adenylyltransferase PcnB [Vicinamibacterales bacterium]